MKNIFKALVLSLIIFLVSGCGKPSIIGTWIYFEGDIENDQIAYVFNSNKTGSYIYYDDELKFTYEDTGSAIGFDYEDATVPSVLDYTIVDDKLILKDTYGSDMIYKRK